MFKKIFLSLVTMVAVSNADISSYEVSPFVGIAEGGHSLSGLKVSANIGEGWAYELSGALRQNADNKGGQDTQFFLDAKKDIIRIENLRLFAGAGLGRAMNTGGVNAFAGMARKINAKGDEIRFDITTQFTNNGLDNSANIGYVITF